jgi:hypothetical protein
MTRVHPKSGRVVDSATRSSEFQDLVEVAVVQEYVQIVLRGFSTILQKAHRVKSALLDFTVVVRAV